MASSIEVRERQKHHLGVLLKLKKRNAHLTIIGLQEDIENAVMVMEQEDVAFIEKIVGVSAI
ncbi:MAG: hypothetical protein FWG44_03730 [Oscillospiraceae bacterium]|nr:hypothetical protein [Oscillospiraceae bacterium]